MELQTQHPGIAGELEHAINTLRKLQRIAGGSDFVVNLAPGGTDRPNNAETLMQPLSGGGGAGAAPAGAAAATQYRVETPILAARENFGRYQIVRLIGRGAMGAVYLAYDPQLERYIAIKTPFLGSDPDTVQRFYREARAAAKLRSPFICTIYDVGEICGMHFLSMEFIEGRPLSRVVADADLKDHRAVARLISKIGRGLQKAHEQGIIHRDLKPDNIMVDASGEPIVMDFGLARQIDDVAQLTTPGMIMGTPSYMSPEQVEGDQRKIGPLSDIYSLGVILYEVLTGQLPFQGKLMSVLHDIMTKEPARPSSVSEQVPADCRLEQICLKLMAKVPSDRFPSMAEVVEALDQFCQPKPPAADTRRTSEPTGWRRLLAPWRFASLRTAPTNGSSGSSAELSKVEVSGNAG
jgi:serine/threonine protein kinase